MFSRTDTHDKNLALVDGYLTAIDMQSVDQTTVSNRNSVGANSTVIIVNYGTANLTIEAIRSVADDPAVFEILVFDNGSPPADLERLRVGAREFGSVRLIESPTNLGFGRANNVAVANAQTRFVFLLNSDAIATRMCVSGLQEEWARQVNLGVLAPNVFLADGRTDQADSKGPFPTATRILTRRSKRYGNSFEPDWVSGCAMFIEKSTYEAVGGFDPEIFMYFEDVLFCWEIRRRGLAVRRTQNASVCHLGGGSHRSWRDAKKNYFQAQDVFLKKLGEPLALRILVRAARWPTSILRQISRASD